MELLKIIEKFSSFIRMEFGVDKCVVMYVKWGGIVEFEGLEFLDFIKLRVFFVNDIYKYLGMLEGLGINGLDMK